MTSFRKLFLFFTVNLLCLVNHAEAREAPQLLPQLTLDDLIKQITDFTLSLSTFDNYASDCRIDIQNHLADPQPILLHPGTTKIYEPQANGQLVIPRNGEIEFNCKDNLLEPFHDRQSVVAKCVGKNRFRVGSKTHSISAFICSSWFSSTARKTGKSCFHNRAAEVEVGFQLSSDKRFVRVFDLCHEEETGRTLYVHHFLTPATNSHRSGVKRLGFKKGNFYGNLNVDKLYKQKTQKETIGRILNGHHDRYFDEKSSLFLARGHLSAKADHVYANEQRATFFFVNAAPQWQVFNAGNWQTIEDDVRIFAERKKLFLECFTGTWGVSTLPDGNGDAQELYLHFDPNGNGNQIPVPMLYYRIVIDTKSRRGIVLIGVNNPHLSLAEIKRDYVICPDVSAEIDYINWKKNDIRLGYSYACEVDDFVRVVDNFKGLDVRGLLV